MNTFSSEEVRAKLTERLPNQERIEHDFAVELAARLPKENMTGTALVLQAQLLLHDMAKGTAPRHLCDFPSQITALLDWSLVELAKRVLPEDGAKDAVAMIEALNERSGR